MLRFYFLESISGFWRLIRFLNTQHPVDDVLQRRAEIGGEGIGVPGVLDLEHGLTVISEYKDVRYERSNYGVY